MNSYYGSNQVDANVPVPVIASFDSTGHIRPLYVRINGTSYKVKTSWLKHAFIGHSIFECQVIDGNYIKPLTITYFSNNGLWSIPRCNMLIEEL